MTIQRWAMMSPENQIIRVDSFKQSSTSLPVHYPGRPEVEPWNQRIRQQPFNEWTVEEERVVVTYVILDISFEELVETAKNHLEALYDEVKWQLNENDDGDNTAILDAARTTILSEIDAFDSSYDIYHYDVDSRFEELAPSSEMEIEE